MDASVAENLTVISLPLCPYAFCCLTHDWAPGSLGALIGLLLFFFFFSLHFKLSMVSCCLNHYLILESL